MIRVPQLPGDKKFFAQSPAASPACNSSPTWRSRRCRLAQSKCRNPASRAPLVAVIVRSAVRNEGAEADYGYMTAFIVERHSLRPKV